MPEGSNVGNSVPTDSGLQCLSLISRFFQLSLDPDQIKHDYGKIDGLFDAVDIVRCAKRSGLLARIAASRWDRLGRIALPAIGELKEEDGQVRFVIFARLADGKLLIQDPRSAGPELKTEQEMADLWTGRVILVTHRQALAGPARGFDLSWFIPAVVRYRKLLGEVLVASFFLQLLGLVSPMFFQVVTDKVLVHRGLSSLDVLVIGLSVVSIFEVLMGGLRTYVFSHTTSRIDVELGVGVFRHLMGLPMAYFATRQAGTTVARVRELENIRNFLTGSALTLVVDAVFTVIFFAVMFLYSIKLTLIVAATIPLYVGLSVLVSPLLKKRVDLKFRHGSENQAFLVEAINAAETCKAMAIEPQMERKWENLQAAYVNASFKAQSLGVTAGQFAQGISKAQTVLTLWIGAQEVMSGDLSIGSLIAFNMMAGRVASPILRMAQLWQDFQQMRVSVERLGDILNTPTERGSASRSNLPAIQGRVTFDNVKFRYRPDRPLVLKGLSIDFAPGESIGLVGSSGSGKSTITKLIQRLYLPESGKVSIDGVDLAMIDTAWLRRQIGVVLQENVLFNRTIRENIALADPSLPMEEVVHAAKLSAAHNFIVDLPEAYDTQIVERGANLSGGQRQRIAIARALITNPRILIFDEATSALDYESEAEIRRNMSAMSKGRTVFIIAHRLSAVRHCTRIVVMEKGELAEQGTHDELIAKGGRYAYLWQCQEAGELDV
jgi:subfamily B ATP-binding cassette protein HlyB/CyaB